MKYVHKGETLFKNLQVALFSNLAFQTLDFKLNAADLHTGAKLLSTILSKCTDTSDVACCVEDNEMVDSRAYLVRSFAGPDGSCKGIVLYQFNLFRNKATCEKLVSCILSDPSFHASVPLY